MPSADSYQPPSSRLAQLARAQQAASPGLMGGRVRQASPIPVRPVEPSPMGGLLYVGPDDPGLDSGYDFWFDTDEPVP